MSLLRSTQRLMPALHRLAAPVQPVGLSKVSSFARAFSASPLRMDTTTRYTPEHEWVTLDTKTNIGTIGITNYAQKSLGDVVYVELPSEGSEVKQGEQIGAVESVKAASDIYSPVTGAVTRVNERLGDESSLLNKSAEDEGAFTDRPLSQRYCVSQLLLNWPFPFTLARLAMPNPTHQPLGIRCPLGQGGL